MAKNNMFLGFARGSVGDITFYRANGQQLARARNRNPSNPRSDAQLIQRAIMASVSRLYSIGRVIFDHSWQGEKVGSGSQRGFVRDNTPLLRNLVISEINGDVDMEESRSRVSAPGVSVAVPFDGMKISNGDYSQQFFARIQDGMVSSFKAPAALEGQTVAQYAAANGLVPGDIYTFTGIAVGTLSSGNIVFDANDDGGQDSYARVFQSRLAYCQLKVKENISSITEVIAASTRLADLFDVYEGNSDISNTLLSSEIALPTLDDTYPDGVLGVIRSRLDSGVRSLSYAYFSSGSTFGLTHQYLLKAWRGGSQGLAGSNLILEGENF